MPIRKRISNPYGAEVKQFDRMLKYGPLPKPPSKRPPASERQPIIDALRIIPVGKNMPDKEWTAKWSNPYIKSKYTIWSIDIAIYPMRRIETNSRSTCNGVFLMGITRTAKNIQPKLRLLGEFSPLWYSNILEWIEDAYFGG